MLQQLLAPPLPSNLDTGTEAFARNRADMLEHLEVIDELLDEAEAGGGPEAMDRMRSRDKMPIRERIGHVLDPDSPFLEISRIVAPFSVTPRCSSIRSMTGCAVSGSNSVELAPSGPHTLRAYSMVAH